MASSFDTHCWPPLPLLLLLFLLHVPPVPTPLPPPGSIPAPLALCSSSPSNFTSSSDFLSSLVHPSSGTALLAFTCTTCCKVRHHVVHTHTHTCTLSLDHICLSLFSVLFYHLVSTQTEAVEHESSPQSTSIMLYVTVGSIKVRKRRATDWLEQVRLVSCSVGENIKRSNWKCEAQWDTNTELNLINQCIINSDDYKSLGFFVFFQICVNDDLVAKKFAHYHSQSVDGKWLDEAEQTPIMLSHSVLMQTAGRTVKEKTIDKINLPPGQHTRTLFLSSLGPDPQRIKRSSKLWPVL